MKQALVRYGKQNEFDSRNVALLDQLELQPIKQHLSSNRSSMCHGLLFGNFTSCGEAMLLVSIKFSKMA